MSPPPDDERRRLEKAYRDLDAQELLRLFEGRQTLAVEAVDALRMELRLRGLDPDSLRATVPKAIPTDDDGASGDASLVDSELAPDEPSKVGAAPGTSAEGDAGNGSPDAASAAEAAASAATIRCTQCGARNPTIEDLCLRCGSPLGEAPQHQTMSRRILESPAAGPRPSGTIASATTGVIGISAIVFSSYSLTLEKPALAVTLLVGVVGVASVIAAVALYRAEKRRKEAEAAVN